jgi:hypothetical protein
VEESHSLTHSRQSSQLCVVRMVVKLPGPSLPCVPLELVGQINKIHMAAAARRTENLQTTSQGTTRPAGRRLAARLIFLLYTH